MSRANRVKRRNISGGSKNKRARGILAGRKLRWPVTLPGRRWSRDRDLPFRFSTPWYQQRADEKRARRRQRRLDVDRHGYVR